MGSKGDFLTNLFRSGKVKDKELSIQYNTFACNGILSTEMILQLKSKNEYIYQIFWH